LVRPLRGRPAADLAALVVSNFADYGVIWVAVAAGKGLGGKERRRRAVRSLAVAGVTSASVNAVVKALVGRQRPEPGARAGREPLPVRAPTSSSFPSGHTLAAFCTAIVFADSAPEAALYLLFATAVGASRVHLSAHHGTDVLGGAMIGLAAGAFGRMMVDAPPGGPA
jgi:undecaprenyl-diphosphatase